MDKDLNSLKGRISDWIREKVEEAGAKGAVIGLSGGIDSSVVAVLAKKSLGDNVLGVIMPCHSKKEDEEHAKALAEKTGIKTEYVDLGPVFDSLRESLPEAEGLVVANIKPRLRMTTLYYFANSRNYLVLGTGNKSELKLGYFTRYGDGGVDLLPIGDLYKTQVTELAKHLNIAREIIEKPPSAGLWPHQRDEDEIGVKYHEIDTILHYLLELKMEPKDIVNKGSLSLEKVKRVLNLMGKNEFKLKTPEVCEL